MTQAKCFRIVNVVLAEQNVNKMYREKEIMIFIVKCTTTITEATNFFFSLFPPELWWFVVESELRGVAFIKLMSGLS